jgi:hypothetical protein
MSEIDYSELIISKKGVVLSDRQVVGNLIGEKDGASDSIYLIPKSNVQSYDGQQLIVNVSSSSLEGFEQKREEDGESVLDDISDKMGDIKDKVVETTKDVADKAREKV